jgi:hypothetical protein
MQINRIIWCNLGLIVAIGIYGLVTDEPYWRDVGHGLWLYDYLFWFALVLNGPAGVLADYISWLTTAHTEARYLIQYALWCLLLWPQWKLYNQLVHWQGGSKIKQVIFWVFVFMIVTFGGIAAYAAWLLDHHPDESPIGQYLLFVRAAGIACSGLVLLVYAHFVANHALTRRSSGTPQKRVAP